MNTIKHFIITHAGCLDGLAAAYFRYRQGLTFVNQEGEKIVQHVLPENVYFLNHNPDQLNTILSLGWVEKLEANEELFVLEFTDCAPTKETLIALLNRFPGIRIAVLDHHKTAEYLSIRGNFLERGSEAWNAISENAHRCTFYIDREESRRSAAMMAYKTNLCITSDVKIEYVINSDDSPQFKEASEWRGIPGMELFARVVSDRDVWTHTYPDTNKIVTALFTLLDIKNDDQSTFDKFNTLSAIIDGYFGDQEELDRLIEIGNVLSMKQEQDVRELAKQAQPMLVVLDKKSHHGLLVNAPGNYSSDLGNYLLQKNDDIDFVVIYSLGKETDKFSVRSKETFDSSEFCARFGGGGHRRAAGFSLSSAYDHEQFHNFLVCHLQTSEE